MARILTGASACLVAFMSLGSTAYGVPGAPIISLEYRAEAAGTTIKTENGQTKAETETKAFAFQIQRARLNLLGKATPNTTFRIRLRFEPNKTAVGGANMQADMLDYAYVQHQISPDFLLTVGRQYAYHGGFGGFADHVYFGAPDIFLQHIGVTGASLAYQIQKSEDQTHAISLYVVNPKDSEDAATKATAKNPELGILYRSSLMNKKVGLIAAHYATPNPGRIDTSTKDAAGIPISIGLASGMSTFSSAGVNVTMAGFRFDLGYIAALKSGQDKTDIATQTVTPVADTKATAIDAYLHYEIDMGGNKWRPLFKTVSEPSKTGSLESTNTQLTTGLEFAPRETNLNYYLAYYNQEKVTPNTRDTTLDDTKNVAVIMLGVYGTLSQGEDAAPAAPAAK